MKTLTESIKDNSIITESIDPKDGLKIPTMKGAESNPMFWEFGYLVFFKQGDKLVVDWCQDGDDKRIYSHAHFKFDYFVPVENFDFDFQKLSKNRSKTLKALKKITAGVDDVTNLKF